MCVTSYIYFIAVYSQVNHHVRSWLCSFCCKESHSSLLVCQPLCVCVCVCVCLSWRFSCADRKCMGITHETMELSHYIHIKIQKACALIFANAPSSVCVCVHACMCVCVCVHVCIQLNGIVLITYVDPTSLDYLLIVTL